MSRRLLSALVIASALCAVGAALCAPGAALRAPGSTLGQAGPAQPAAPASPVSSHAMVSTCCTATAMKETIFAEAAASGAEFVRVDVELNGIFEGAGSREHPDWRALDELIELAERHDVRLLGLILGVPTWLSDCPERGPDAPRCAARDPAEFGRLAAAVAEHAGGSIEHWEILNEPDAEWAFKGGPHDYARMLSAAYDSIKARVPDAQIVMGGVERPREHDWIRRMLATPGADAARKFDVAAVHLRLRLRNVLADLPDYLRAWRELLAGHGFTGPIWVTEHGYPADPAFQWDPAYRGGDPAQAAFLRDSIPLLTEAGAEQVFVTLRDNLWGEYLSEGLVHIDEAQPDYPAARRPSFEAVRRLAGAAEQDEAEPPGAGPEQLQHERMQQLLEQLAAQSRSAGHELAAALQEGAARGHALIAERLATTADAE